VAFLDGWLEPLIVTLDQQPDVALAAPVLLDDDHAVQEAGYFLFDDGQTRPDRRPLGADEVRDVVYSSAACWLLRRDDLLAAGGFDPDYHPAYYEDVDVALRLGAGGRRSVVVGASRVIHLLHGGTPDGRPPDVTRQREVLLDHWPSIRADFPAIPVDLM